VATNKDGSSIIVASGASLASFAIRVGVKMEALWDQRL
jgi:hypothetical protein